MVICRSIWDKRGGEGKFHNSLNITHILRFEIWQGSRRARFYCVHLAGIAPPHIRRTVACRMERTRQMTDARHQLFHHQPAASRLKSRKSFMRSHAARLVCKQQQTGALERQPDRRASLRQNGTGGGRVFAGWIWRKLALLASP